MVHQRRASAIGPSDRFGRIFTHEAKEGSNELLDRVRRKLLTLTECLRSFRYYEPSSQSRITTRRQVSNKRAGAIHTSPFLEPIRNSLTLLW